MITIQNSLFSIGQICESGQCFRLRPLGENRYGLTALGRYLLLEQDRDTVTFFCPPEEFDEVWENYFDLKADYGDYLDSAPKGSRFLCQAADFGRGIRILRQDLWETTVSFIVSQQNNIKRIRRCIDLLCERYGERKYAADGAGFFDFPSAAVLADADEADLRACNLGYRGRYIKAAARSVRDREIRWDHLAEMGYEEAKAELMKLPGVGTKVADCICLFGLHRLEAFPVDTHIRQVLERHYPDGFPYEAFPGYAGVMQQYIFYYETQRDRADR